MLESSEIKLKTEYSTQILDNLNMGVLVLSGKTIEYINAYLAQQLSYHPAELLKTDATQYFSSDDFDLLQQPQQPVLKKYIKGINKEGEIIPFSAQLKQIKLGKQSKRVVLLEKIVNDTLTAGVREDNSKDLKYIVDKLKLDSSMIKREKQQIELILNNISDGIIVVDQDGKTLTVNQAAKQIIKKILSFEITNDFNFILSSGHIFFDTIRKIFLSNDLYQREVIEAMPGVFIEFTVALNSSAKQNSLVTIVEFRDITPFIAFDNLRKKFVSVVSHELRTPISAINLALINLQRFGTKLTEEQKQALISSMGRSAAVLNQQVDDLLILSRFDAGKSLDLKWEKYHLFGTIYSVLAQLEPRRAEKNIDIQVIGDQDVELLGDTHRIEQILRIILDNAIKYSNANSSILIKVFDQYIGQYAPHNTLGTLIEVIDSGMGISKKDLPHIFTRFYRADDVAHIQGTGIGLALAKELVQLHQGVIHVESEYKKGTTFIIFLPFLDSPPKYDKITNTL